MAASWILGNIQLIWFRDDSATVLVGDLSRVLLLCEPMNAQELSFGTLNNSPTPASFV